MDIDKLLTIKGIYRGTAGSGYQYYQILLVDQEEKKYLTTVGCQIIYQATCEKTFNRLVFVSAPKAEEISEETNKESTDKGEVKNEGIHLVSD